MLLLRGSEHGFSSEIFHNLCDNKGKIICIVKDTYRRKLGAYTDIDFDQSNQSKKGNKNSFMYIFSNDKKIEKSTCINENYEIYCSKSSSMTFAGIQDFYIGNNCNQTDYNHFNPSYARYYGNF